MPDRPVIATAVGFGPEEAGQPCVACSLRLGAFLAELRELVVRHGPDGIVVMATAGCTRQVVTAVAKDAPVTVSDLVRTVGEQAERTTRLLSAAPGGLG